ncbi:unnamed protein product [Brassica rapa subsp. narinosa]
MFLEDVVLPNDAAAEALISSSPVLEVLKISLSRDDFVVALRVCSPSLKSFTTICGMRFVLVKGAKLTMWLVWTISVARKHLVNIKRSLHLLLSEEDTRIVLAGTRASQEVPCYTLH